MVHPLCEETTMEGHSATMAGSDFMEAGHQGCRKLSWCLHSGSRDGRNQL